MSIKFRTYQNDTRFGADYHKLRKFLLEIDNHNYTFGRWDWMITHGYLDESGLSKIGLWEADTRLVGLATYDCSLGESFLLTAQGYDHLKEEILLYAKAKFAKDGKFRALILDGDTELQNIAVRNGFFPTQNKEFDAIFPIDNAEKIHYTLPAGFTITSMKESYDLYKYEQVLWKGFNHEANGEGSLIYDEKKRQENEMEFLRPNVNLDIKIAVVAPNGDFVSYCGMWQDSAVQSALVEPVATDPAYRNMGLGRAAVLEAIRRCGKLGAKRAFVGSSQQFYYNIGFRPYATLTWWEAK